MLSGNLSLWHCINAPVAMIYLRGCLILTFHTGFLFKTYLINVMQMVMMMMVMVVWPAMGLVFLLLVFPALTSTFIRAVKAFTTADVLLLVPGGVLQGPLMILFGIRCWTWDMNRKKTCQENVVCIYSFKAQNQPSYSNQWNNSLHEITYVTFMLAARFRGWTSKSWLLMLKAKKFYEQ